MGKDATINGERLRALCILTYSDNLELQRSAALCYAEISAKSEYSHSACSLYQWNIYSSICSDFRAAIGGVVNIALGWKRFIRNGIKVWQ